MRINPLTSTDFYKTGHIAQYPEGTEMVYSNMTARGAHHAVVSKDYDNKIVFFGLQGFIQWFLVDLFNKEFFQKPKSEVVSRYKRRMDTALGPDSVNVKHIEDLHDLGYLPLQIKALPEGSRVNLRVPFLTIVNTQPEFFWLTNYVETVLSNELWKSITTATTAYEFRRNLDKWVEKTGSSKEFANWQNHDFSMRGLSGVHDSASSAAGHLLSNFGTDTITAIDYLEDYYFANAEKELIGGSVPATEHSVMCMGGNETEIETFRRLITQVYPAGIVSIVSDTWDFWKVITEYSKELKTEILNRTPNALGMAKVVFRPDSGNPTDIISGTIKIREFKSGTPDEIRGQLNMLISDTVDEVTSQTPFGKIGSNQVDCFYRFEGIVYKVSVGLDWNRHDKTYYYLDDFYTLGNTAYEPTPEEKGAIECLWEIFGGDVNEKGYKTLNQRVGLIYGDSITLDRQEEILKRLADKGFSAGNIVFGVGSYTYQYVTRDTFGIAVKATAGIVNNEFRELFKDPVTDNGVKKSARGLLRVEKENGNYVLYEQQSDAQECEGLLRPVFISGICYNQQTLAEIRQRLKDEK